MCSVVLILGENWTVSSRNHRIYRCKSCVNEVKKIKKSDPVIKFRDDITDKKRYRSIRGLLLNRYSGMKQRSKIYNYGISITKEEFLTFSLNDINFIDIYKNWISSDYNNKSSPSVDRIDSNKGYCLGNIQWLTFSENCSKGIGEKPSEHINVILQGSRWRPYVCSGGKNKYLGSFKTKEKAIEVLNNYKLGEINE